MIAQKDIISKTNVRNERQDLKHCDRRIDYQEEIEKLWIQQHYQFDR